MIKAFNANGTILAVKEPKRHSLMNGLSQKPLETPKGVEKARKGVTTMKPGKAILVFSIFSLLWQLPTAQDQAEPAQPAFAPQIFWVHNVFLDSRDVKSINEDAAKSYRNSILEAKIAGLIPVGNTTSWVFPSFVEVPKVPIFHNPSPNTVLVRQACIPELLGPEYSSLAEIRNQLYGTLAREFPEVSTWVVGLEAEFDFRDCNGEQLELEEMVRFIVDTLVGTTRAIKEETPGATVIGHFLGNPHIPIVIQGRLIQPSTFAQLIDAELGQRLTNQSNIPDLWISDLAPQLLVDRFPRNPVMVDFEASGSRSAGWNVKWLEEFTSTTSNLVTNYDEWDDIDYNPSISDKTVIAVNADEEAELRLVTSSKQYDSFAAARSNPNEVDVVPDDEFDSGVANRNKWTAVMDFFPVEETDDSSVHAGGFLRVNDRTMEQTRFGTIAYSGDRSTSPCASEPCGAIQFTGDDDENPSQLLTELKYFELDEQPWDYPTHLYRVQIIEWEHEVPVLGWHLVWKAEIWDLTDNDLIGSSSSYTEYTVSSWGIDIPGLSDSMIAFGLSSGDDGGIDNERTGTSYWEY